MIDAIEVNINNMTGTWWLQSSGVSPKLYEEQEIKIIEIKNSMLIYRSIKKDDQPYSLIGMHTQYWRSDNIFQLINEDLYIDNTTLQEIKSSEYYHELKIRPIVTKYECGYF